MLTPDEDDPENDKRLAASAADGDAGAFETLFDRWYDPVYGLAYKLCGHREDALDIAQETFVKAARSIKSFRGDGSFKSWVFAIAANLARDLGRRRQRANIQPLQDSHIGHSPLPVEGLSLDIADALASLDEPLREAVVLVYAEGFTHAEAGRAIGCAEGTVSWRVSEAKAKLRYWFEQNGGTR